MFTGFTQDTVDFFVTLRFNNYTSFFQEHKQEYIDVVRTPFYEFIESMAPTMLKIDPEMEVRPYKCLARIRRDTRFTKDKSPYRDHLWVMFKKAALPKEESLMFWFEFSPTNMDWGMGFWGENRPALDLLRKNLVAKPQQFLSIVKKSQLAQHRLALTGDDYKRITLPDGLPVALHEWYIKKRLYLQKMSPDYDWAFDKDLISKVSEDFLALKPLYIALQGMVDKGAEEINQEKLLNQ